MSLSDDKQADIIDTFNTNEFPGLKWPPFFFYLTTLIHTNMIDV